MLLIQRSNLPNSDASDIRAEFQRAAVAAMTADSVHQRPRPVDHLVPIERRAGVRLVRLHVVVPQHALVLAPRVVVQLVRNELPVGVARIVALQLGEDPAQRRGQLDQRVVLLGREVVLARDPSPGCCR